MQLSPKQIAAARAACNVVALTGAGISAESGIPTFREAQTGLWAQYDPSELATPEAFQHNPELVWEWYQWRRQIISNARPNAGHTALAELPSRVPNFTLITQNVDGFHQQAGSKNPIELHGNINRSICFKNRHSVTDWPSDGPQPPLCPECGSMLRPDVVWFGENLPPHALAAAFTAAESAEVFFSIGTSSLVEPAASLPIIASQNGAILIEINPSETPISYLAHLIIREPAAAALPPLINRFWPSEEV